MAEYTRNRRAGAYFYGTEGSAALAGKTIIQQKRKPRPTGAAQPGEKAGPAEERLSIKRITFSIPRWSVMLLGVVLGVTVLCLLTSVSVRKATMRQELQEQLGFLAQAEQRATELDAKLQLASEDERIRSHALNRLGLKEPEVYDVYLIPQPAVNGKQETFPQIAEIQIPLSEPQEIIPEESAIDQPVDIQQSPADETAQKDEIIPPWQENLPEEGLFSSLGLFASGE